MSVIDILTLSDDGNPGVYGVPFFTANTAVNEVAVTCNAVPNFFWGVFSTPSGLNIFTPQDNCRILSMTLILPYCFGLGSTIPEWGLVWKDAGTTAGYAVSEWASDSRQWHGLANTEIPIDQYLPFNPLLSDQPGQLCVGILNMTVSMIGVPAALNGADFEIQIALKIEHNIELT